jgi:anti-anti-sigma factor
VELTQLLQAEVVNLTSGGRLVFLRGELDLASRDELGALFKSLVGTPLLVDMRGLSFIDATGVEALIAARDGARSAGCHFEIRGVSHRVRRVLDLLGLDDLLGDEGTVGAHASAPVAWGLLRRPA